PAWIVIVAGGRAPELVLPCRHRMPVSSAAPPRSRAPADALPRYDALDGLRAIAALLVVFAHAMLLPYPSPAAARWAVDLFFVLSGFLITRILLANRVAGEPAWRFWVHRAARILPIYYLTVLAVWVASRDALAPWAAVYLSNYRYALTGAPPS